MSRFFLLDSWYFITVPTDRHRPIFKDLALRELLRVRLEEAFVKFGVECPDYGIMEDHYHFLGSFGKSDVIPTMLQWINGGVSFQVKRQVDIASPVWGEYHVFVPMKESLLDRVRGYVIGNPLKHGDVTDLQELFDWPFSSYRYVIVREGKEYADDVISSVMSLGEKEFFESLPTRITAGLKSLGSARD
ncbi:MAG: transposase [Candidatus Uhrbacteria bacterium]